MGLEFILFVILGWCVFAPPSTERGKTVLMIVFVVLMVLWLLGNVLGLNIPFFFGPHYNTVR